MFSFGFIHSCLLENKCERDLDYPHPLDVYDANLR